jgi:hypothetical protein
MSFVGSPLDCHGFDDEVRQTIVLLCDHTAHIPSRSNSTPNVAVNGTVLVPCL